MTVALTLDQLVASVPGAVSFGEADVVISHLTEDSRQIRPGSLFVARQGERVDGRKYAQLALESGASAVLCECGSGLVLEPRLEVPELAAAWGVLAQKIAGEPSKRLKVVGITGTNGKTTVASLVAQALASLGQVVARSGTLGFFIGDEKIEDSLTTPMPDQLARLMSLAVEQGADFAVLEVSSHALSQKRVAGLSFEVTALTNLSQDHLDYHETFEAYGRAKAKLFSDYSTKAMVFNLDDAWCRQLALLYPASLNVSSLPDAEWVGEHLGAQIIAKNARFLSTGITALVSGRDAPPNGDTALPASWRQSLCSPLLGRHNLENLLVAWGILSGLGFNAPAISHALSTAAAVPGRLERCETQEDDICVVVDYAHTPDALLRVLVTLEELQFSELSCVFGCGGDRDRTKRPLMGQAVADHADHIFVTSDNPRMESPQGIIDDILPGLGQARGSLHVELDRRISIERAILGAQPGGCVLIAGKGHEDYQIVGEHILPFDDRAEARRALALRRLPLVKAQEVS